MTQRERDRLVALKKADEKLITQKQAAQQIGLSERQVRRLLAKLRSQGVWRNRQGEKLGVIGQPQNRRAVKRR